MGNAISRVLKTSCSLEADNLLKMNSMRDHFLDIFSKFQSTIKKFGQEFVSSSGTN